jgi:hypothetical protein
MQKIPSPFVPKVSGPGDASNFNDYTDEPPTWDDHSPDEYSDSFRGF